MWNGMKSVVHFHPMQSPEQRKENWNGWLEDTGRKSSIADKAVPTAAQTRAYLKKRGYYETS